MSYQILQGNNADVLRTFPDNHFDSIVTDPPYGIDFLGKAWDANTGALETYQECLRVLKPGGHILAFSAARTYHHLAVTIEQAGFEIRDQIMWIYSSGFPKSQDVGKSIQRSLGVKKTKKAKGLNAFNQHNDCGWVSQDNTYGSKKDEVICTDPEAQQWAGWGTQLKPAHEPIVLARKPIKLSIAGNCQQWGVGALNIDATRIPGQKTDRFPSNVIGDIAEPYQKYFYCPKVSRAERHTGFDLTNVPVATGGMWDTDGTGIQYNVTKKIATEASMLSDMGGYYVDKNNAETKLTGKNIWLPQTGRIYVHGLKEEYRKWCVANNKTPNVGNNHPTVKPIELMKYLIKLVTPAGGRVLDPFSGSGSTGCAAVELGYDYTGIELDPAYVAIAERRIAAWYQHTHPNTFTELFET